MLSTLLLVAAHFPHTLNASHAVLQGSCYALSAESKHIGLALCSVSTLTSSLQAVSA